MENNLKKDMCITESLGCISEANTLLVNLKKRKRNTGLRKQELNTN